MTATFQLVDVFGEEPFTGNPLAVVTSDRPLDVAKMQQITRWLNLSETTFLLPPTSTEADYRVRIFTLERELPFAGHPTLGTCHAWLAAGGVPRTPGTIVQECGAGLIRLRWDGDRLAFAAPPILRSGDVDEVKLAEIASLLRIERSAIIAAQWVDNGPGWVAVMLESAEAVLALDPVRAHGMRIDLGVVGLYPPGAPAAYEVRALFSDPFGGLIEDPVTGSLNASLAQWLLASGRVRAPYTASQGGALGRKGRIGVECCADGQVWISGRTRTLFSGTVDV
jgi:PhzF family phenazine biosynthesis protein